MGFCRKTSSGVQRGCDSHRNMDCKGGTLVDAVHHPSDGTPLLTQTSLPGYTSPLTPSPTSAPCTCRRSRRGARHCPAQQQEPA